MVVTVVWLICRVCKVNVKIVLILAYSWSHCFVDVEEVRIALHKLRRIVLQQVFLGDLFVANNHWFLYLVQFLHGLIRLHIWLKLPFRTWYETYFRQIRLLILLGTHHSWIGLLLLLIGHVDIVDAVCFLVLDSWGQFKLLGALALACVVDEIILVSKMALNWLLMLRFHIHALAPLRRMLLRYFFARIVDLSCLLYSLLIYKCLLGLTCKLVRVDVCIWLHVLVSDFLKLLFIKTDVNTIEVLFCPYGCWLRVKSVICLTRGLVFPCFKLLSEFVILPLQVNNIFA